MVYRILAGTALVLALSIIAGTIYALAVQSTQNNPPPRETGLGEPLDGGATFTGIGRIRVSTAPPAPATVIFSVIFPYDPGDKAFTEELASRIKELRSAASEYFGSFTAEDLHLLDEDKIKTELLHRYNALLRLGRIEVLYLSDFMIIE